MHASHATRIGGCLSRAADELAPSFRWGSSCTPGRPRGTRASRCIALCGAPCGALRRCTVWCTEAVHHKLHDAMRYARHLENQPGSLRPRCMRLQPLLRAVTAPVACGYSACCMRLQLSAPRDARHEPRGSPRESPRPRLAFWWRIGACIAFASSSLASLACTRSAHAT